MSVIFYKFELQAGTSTYEVAPEVRPGNIKIKNRTADYLYLK